MARESMILAAWRLNRKYPLLILLLILLNLAVYAAMSYWISPRLAAAEREYIEVQAQARQARQERLSEEAPQRSFRRNLEDLAAFREAIPPKAELSALVGEIFSLAGAAGLAIDSVSYAPEEIEERGLLGYSLIFSVSGKYAQVKKFVFALEQSSRLIFIEGLSLRGEGDPGQRQVGLNIRLSTLFRTDVS